MHRFELKYVILLILAKDKEYFIKRIIAVLFSVRQTDWFKNENNQTGRDL
jgi:hypothetical protein